MDTAVLGPIVPLEPNRFRDWYADNPPDFSWLEKPTRHQFRWRLPSNRWITSTRQFNRPKPLQNILKNQGPRDVYIGTAQWLDPVNLPRLRDTHLPHPVLLDHMIVFDIDYTPFCYRRIEKARKATVALLTYIESHENFNLQCITYSGGKGFHLIFRDKDRTLFAIPDPKEREEAVKQSRKSLLKRVIEAGHPVDTTVTADIRRIIRLPGTLHGRTKWRCTRISREQLFRPLKYWIGDVDRGKMAKKMPYFEYSLTLWLRNSTHGFRTLFRQRKHSKPRHQTLPTQPSSETTTLQVSTQVVGTKSRNVFCVWFKENTSDRRMKKIAAKLAANGLGPVHRFSDGERYLLLSIRAIPREQLRKILRELNFNQQSGELHRLSHHWVNLYELQEEGDQIFNRLTHVGKWAEAGNGKSKIPISNCHLSLLNRLGVHPTFDGSEIAGSTEPSLRFAKTK
jgi:DNA primase catalytic subunit